MEAELKLAAKVKEREERTIQHHTKLAAKRLADEKMLAKTREEEAVALETKLSKLREKEDEERAKRQWVSQGKESGSPIF